MNQGSARSLFHVQKIRRVEDPVFRPFHPDLMDLAAEGVEKPGYGTGVLQGLIALLKEILGILASGLAGKVDAG